MNKRTQGHIPSYWVAGANQSNMFVNNAGAGYDPEGRQVLEAYRKVSSLDPAIWKESRAAAKTRRDKVMARIESMAGKKSPAFNLQTFLKSASGEFDKAKVKPLKKMFPFVWDLIPKKGTIFYIARREVFMDNKFNDQRSVFGEIELNHSGFPDWTQDRIAFHALRIVGEAIRDQAVTAPCALLDAEKDLHDGFHTVADASVVIMAYLCAWLYGDDCAEMGCAWVTGSGPSRADGPAINGVQSKDKEPIDLTEIRIPMITKKKLWNDKVLEMYGNEMYEVVKSFAFLDEGEVAKRRQKEREIAAIHAAQRAKDRKYDPNYQRDAATGSQIRAAYENSARLHEGVHDSRMDGADGV